MDRKKERKIREKTTLKNNKKISSNLFWSRVLSNANQICGFDAMCVCAVCSWALKYGANHFNRRSYTTNVYCLSMYMCWAQFSGNLSITHVQNCSFQTKSSAEFTMNFFFRYTFFVTCMRVCKQPVFGMALICCEFFFIFWNKFGMMLSICIVCMYKRSMATMLVSPYEKLIFNKFHEFYTVKQPCNIFNGMNLQ